MRDIHPLGGYPGAPEHRSIRSIPVSGRRHAEHHAERVIEYDEPRPPRRRGRGGLWLTALAVVVVFAIGGVLLSTVFAGATVAVYPRQATVTPPAVLEARLTAPVGGLEYKELAATSEATLVVASNRTEQVSRQASAMVVVQNTFSAEPQRLIANTRFEAPDGKIYRIRESVTVPGMSGTTPGSVGARIYADSPGASYNKVGQTTLTIPGFKGDPRYSKFKAVTQGDIMGGFVGTEPAVAAADLQAAQSSLQKKLDSDVRAAAVASLPQGYGLVPGTLTIEYSEITKTPADGNRVTLAQNAKAKGAMVHNSDLGAAIARATVSGYQGEAVALDASSLTISASSTGEGVLSLALSGSAILTWQFNPAALQEALAGKSKSSFQQVLGSFSPAIHCATERPCDAQIRPFWASSFPSDTNKIKVINKGF